MSIEEAVQEKRRFLIGYFGKIKAGDAVLIVNIRKHGIEGYVGANTLMEAARGMALGKPVYFFHELGEQSCRMEALAVSAGVLNGDAGKLQGFRDVTAAPSEARDPDIGHARPDPHGGQ